MDPVLKIFIYATAVAVVLQMIILLVMAVTMRKTSTRVAVLAQQVHSKAMPLLESTSQLMAVARPNIESITSNMAATTATLRRQVERLDTTLSDILDRTRLQVIRADDIVTRTLDKVDETTNMVRHTVIAPVRQLSGIVQGLSVGIGMFLGNRRRARRGNGAGQDEELFI